MYRPLAKTYDLLTPNFLQHGIKNFFANVHQVPTIANDLLQGNVQWAASDTGRLLVNTTVGVAGLFDVATPSGIEKHDQDFGLTLAKWGIKDSPYFLFPFWGPSTARDLLGAGLDTTFLSVWFYVKPNSVAYSAAGLDFIQTRAAWLPNDSLIDQAFDPYIFTRDAYLQNRSAKIQKILHPGQENDYGYQTPDPLPIDATQ